MTAETRQQLDSILSDLDKGKMVDLREAIATLIRAVKENEQLSRFTETRSSPLTEPVHHVKE